MTDPTIAHYALAKNDVDSSAPTPLLEAADGPFNCHAPARRRYKVLQTVAMAACYKVICNTKPNPTCRSLGFPATV